MATIASTLQGADNVVLFEVISEIVHGKLKRLFDCAIDADVMGGAIKMRMNAVITIVSVSTRCEKGGCEMLEIWLSIERVFG